MYREIRLEGLMKEGAAHPNHPSS